MWICLVPDTRVEPAPLVPASYDGKIIVASTEPERRFLNDNGDLVPISAVVERTIAVTEWVAEHGLSLSDTGRLILRVGSP